MTNKKDATLGEALLGFLVLFLSACAVLSVGSCTFRAVGWGTGLW